MKIRSNPFSGFIRLDPIVVLDSAYILFLYVLIEFFFNGQVFGCFPGVKNNYKIKEISYFTNNEVSYKLSLLEASVCCIIKSDPLLFDIYP